MFQGAKCHNTTNLYTTIVADNYKENLPSNITNQQKTNQATTIEVSEAAASLMFSKIGVFEKFA